MADGMQQTIEAEGAVQQEQFMRWSETRSEIAKALAKAQATLSPVLKDSTNPHFGNKYAELSTVLAAVMPALNAAHCGWSASASPVGASRSSS